ncbi:hypothetical protein [Natranaerobius trueperi]|uniref:Phosphatidic acid phosphatase type 2/haloperoxidase domain-containing protein n=1 Tax=Natranaerobius trueperi TaxID=759412 RepID=A0A226BUK5_9FIRM|nr:hypothetical protein [Natranaerobius trueperi]OWZ82653.1 hypothetical protein CDO51_12930 [Natranaerobius trueperi]
MPNKLAKLISILTVVPMIALLVITLIYLNYSTFFNNSLSWFLMSNLFLVIIPLSAYILKKYIPKYNIQGRKGERKLAFTMAALGQITGAVTVVSFDGPQGVKLLFLTYVLAGLILTTCNTLINYKASGHACGVAGPLTFLSYFLGRTYLSLFILLPIVFWARLYLKRHTIGELCLGAMIGIFATITVVY